MCPCTSTHNGIPYWKFVSHCCDKCPNIVIPSHEANKDTAKTCPTMYFHIYRNVSHSTVQEILRYKERTECSTCFTVTRNATAEKYKHKNNLCY